MDIAAWLRELGLEQYVQAFADNDVDARTLRLLTEADLADIGVTSIGHRRKLAAAIATLRDGRPTVPRHCRDRHRAGCRCASTGSSRCCTATWSAPRRCRSGWTRKNIAR